jgi:predicted ribosomally synthesized peptide with SipW-like signal peptide
MKKIILGVIAIALTVGGVSGAAYALFSDTKVIGANTIQSGTVTLDIVGLVNKPINATNMAPGNWTLDGKAGLYNTGSLPVRLYMYVDHVVGAACPKTNLRMKTGPAGGDEFARTIFYEQLVNITGAGNRREVTGSPPFAILLPNWTQVVHQQAELDISADNTYKNTGCTWDEYFVAENVPQT